MNHQNALGILANKLATFPGVEGVFLSGSLANQFQDEFSDIDLGVATVNGAEALDEVFSLRHQLITAVGEPAHSLEQGWGHCKMIAALYGKSLFPPMGLEIDIIFSQLRHVSEQMPYAEYRIVYDRNGKLQPMLARIGRSRPGQDIEKEIAGHLAWFPFYMHDARKACRRGDRFQVQSLLEEIRKLIFFAAATRQGAQVYGVKRAYRFLCWLLLADYGLALCSRRHEPDLDCRHRRLCIGRETVARRSQNKLGHWGADDRLGRLDDYGRTDLI